MCKSLLTLGAALTLTSGMLLGFQQPASAQPVQLVVVDVHAVATGYRASKLTGSGVVNEKGERIGTIDDLVIGADQPRVLFAILQVGGFLGLGGHLVATPFTSLQFDGKGKITLPGATKEALTKLPQFTYPVS